ncbi:MAG TPA: acyl-CoA dehydrogenase family protein [Bacteroidetes bacterium]|nr:acyl-CoA dehydrogenase family protein [Candidatus Limimorpha avicola]
MDFGLTKEQQELRAKVREFAEREVKPVASYNDENEIFDVDLTLKMSKLGLLGMCISEDYGGHGLDVLSYIIAVEELARVDGSTAATIAAHNSLGIGPINDYGTEEQKMRYLPRLCSDRLWGFGLTEPTAGSDSRGTKTCARFVDGKWIVNGSKMFITNSATSISMGSTIQTISGEVNGKPEFTTFLIENDTEGFTQKPVNRKMMWRASNTGELIFNNVQLDNANMLGARGQGSHIMLATLDSGRLSIGAMGLGCAQGAFEMALAYSKEREQFGKPICKFQAVSFMLADMATKIEAARGLLYKACRMKDLHLPFGKEAAMAKLYCSQVAAEVCDNAVQVMGGHGLLKDFDMERFYRDQRILQIGEGTSEILRLVISRYVGC